MDNNKHKKEKYQVMDTNKIKALLAAVEQGSLTSAARDLGYTQSGLTHMMNSLEEELGVNLLVRSKTGVRFSPAGQELMGSMQDVVDAAETLAHRAEELRERRISTLRLGAYSSIARHWLPAILANYRRECPGTDVSITMSNIQDIYGLVKSDRLDCAMVSYQPALCQGLAWVPLRKDALVAILPGDYDGAVFSYPVESFAGQEFLMPGDGFDMDIMPVFSSAGHKVLPCIRYTGLDDDIVASMVEHGLGVSVLSELVMQGIRGKVCALPLDPPAYRQLGMIINPRLQSDSGIRRFIHFTRNTIAEMYNE